MKRGTTRSRTVADVVANDGERSRKKGRRRKSREARLEIPAAGSRQGALMGLSPRGKPQKHASNASICNRSKVNAILPPFHPSHAPFRRQARAESVTMQSVHPAKAFLG